MLEIISTGLVNSLRKANDGIVYFGNTTPKLTEVKRFCEEVDRVIQ